MSKINTQYGYYTVDANKQLHSEDDKPAVVESSRTEYNKGIEVLIDGFKSWYRHGRLHREIGPAIKRNSGINLFYLNGQFIKEEE